MLSPGDPAPWFLARGLDNPTFHFDAVAGRYVVLCFFGSAADPAVRRVLEDVDRSPARFDGTNACFLGVSSDPEDERQERLRRQGPGIMYLWDFDLAISRLYGAAPADGAPYQRHTLVLDPALRTVAVLPWEGDAEAHVADLLRRLDALPPLNSLEGVAPVLVVPRVFEPEFCRVLIEAYERHGGEDSGYMTEVDGRTVGVVDHSYKRRRDYTLTDRSLIEAAQLRLSRRLLPEIQKAFQFHATRIERNIVACYDAATGGHFQPHRDNTTRGTAHRRFAVTINLNAEEYAGGDLRFPEFGPRLYRAPTGGAVVFSCSLLHEATPVTQGTRYAFLPFLYDDEAARVRRENQRFLAGNSPPPS